MRNADFRHPGKVAIRVGIGGGHVSFDTVDGATTTVDVEALRDDEITREAIDAMTIEARDRGDHHEIVVEAPSATAAGSPGSAEAPRSARPLPARFRRAGVDELGGRGS